MGFRGSVSSNPEESFGKKNEKGYFAHSALNMRLQPGRCLHGKVVAPLTAKHAPLILTCVAQVPIFKLCRAFIRQNLMNPTYKPSSYKPDLLVPDSLAQEGTQDGPSPTSEFYPSLVHAIGDASRRFGSSMRAQMLQLASARVG